MVFRAARPGPKGRPHSAIAKPRLCHRLPGKAGTGRQEEGLHAKLVQRGDRREGREPGRARELLADTTFELGANQERNLGRLTDILDQRAHLGFRPAAEDEAPYTKLERARYPCALGGKTGRRVPGDNRNQQLSDVTHGRVI